MFSEVTGIMNPARRTTPSSTWGRRGYSPARRVSPARRLRRAHRHRRRHNVPRPPDRGSRRPRRARPRARPRSPPRQSGRRADRRRRRGKARPLPLAATSPYASRSTSSPRPAAAGIPCCGGKYNQVSRPNATPGRSGRMPMSSPGSKDVTSSLRRCDSALSAAASNVPVRRVFGSVASASTVLTSISMPISGGTASRTSASRAIPWRASSSAVRSAMYEPSGAVQSCRSTSWSSAVRRASTSIHGKPAAAAARQDSTVFSGYPPEMPRPNPRCPTTAGFSAKTTCPTIAHRPRRSPWRSRTATAGSTAPCPGPSAVAAG